MGLTREEREQLRNLRSDLQRARLKRTPKARMPESCPVCGDDGYGLACETCRKRFALRVKDGDESRQAYDVFLRERREHGISRRPGA